MDKKIAKQRIRQEMKELRNGLNVFAVENLSDDVFEKFTQLNFNEYENFFVYNSFGSEVQTQKIIEYLLAQRKNVFMPRIKERQMQAVQVDKKSKFVRNTFGILEPEGKPEEIYEFVAVMPCLAIDLVGNRIGYGGGYYDSFLQDKNVTKVALCYDFQIINKIPSEEFDVKVDIIISDKRVLRLQSQNIKTR